MNLRNALILFVLPLALAGCRTTARTQSSSTGLTQHDSTQIMHLQQRQTDSLGLSTTLAIDSAEIVYFSTAGTDSLKLWQNHISRGNKENLHNIQLPRTAVIRLRGIRLQTNAAAIRHAVSDSIRTTRFRYASIATNDKQVAKAEPASFLSPLTFIASVAGTAFLALTAYIALRLLRK